MRHTTVLRADDQALRAPTPHIDKLASEGMRLLNFNVEAQCTPSRSAILTGRFAIRSGTHSVPIGGGLDGSNLVVMPSTWFGWSCFRQARRRSGLSACRNVWQSARSGWPSGSAYIVPRH